MTNLEKVIAWIEKDEECLRTLERYTNVEGYYRSAWIFNLGGPDKCNGVRSEWEWLMMEVDDRCSELRDYGSGPSEEDISRARKMALRIQEAIDKDEAKQ